MKNICSNCEAENEINSKYCSVCGYKLPILENQKMKTESEQTKVTKPKRKFDLKTAIGFIVGFIIMFFVTQSFFKPSVDKQLADFASEFNKNCPMNLDEYTTLKNAVALPNKTIQYNYILVGVDKSQINLDTIKKYVYPGVLQNIKTNPDMKLFRDSKVTFNYYYTDKNGVYVDKYVIRPEMYE
jgi:hypothetical protein